VSSIQPLQRLLRLLQVLQSGLWLFFAHGLDGFLVELVEELDEPAAVLRRRNLNLIVRVGRRGRRLVGLLAEQTLDPLSVNLGLGLGQQFQLLTLLRRSRTKSKGKTYGLLLML